MSQIIKFLHYIFVLISSVRNFLDFFTWKSVHSYGNNRETRRRSRKSSVASVDDSIDMMPQVVYSRIIGKQ